MQPIIAVYDACVLYPAFLRDFLVRLAVHGRALGAVRAKWTGRIHGEWISAVIRHDPLIDRSRLRRTSKLMDLHVRGCRVLGYERWEGRLTLPDRKDRHVLAAALACVADVIVTFNLKDFPSGARAPFGIVALPPDQFVQNLMDFGIVRSAAAEHRAALNRPPMTAAEYLDALRRNGLPATAAALALETV
jgi:hypothetical protein